MTLPEPEAEPERAWLRPGAEVVPDHQLLRRIGRGSYGEVWLARNILGVYRAVKIVCRSSFKEQGPFEREWSGIQNFEPVSRSHEGFVDVLQVGINQAKGYFYYVMELADDRVAGSRIQPESYSPKTLAKAIKASGRLPVRDCLALGLALSLALDELHKCGLVHRDVKPSNIVFVHGVPKLADIGLVADASDARSYVGTESYIPPEGPGHAQADVFSLGKVLYECCTGKDRQEFPDLPSLWDREPDQAQFLELNAIVLKACKPDAKERYASAWDLYSHLLLVANGKSVQRLIASERTLAYLKRLGLVLGLGLLVLVPVGLLLVRESQRARERIQQQVGADVAYGNRALEAGDLLSALPHFARARQLDRGQIMPRADHRLRCASTLGNCPKLVQVLWVERTVTEAHFHPAGRWLLCAQDGGRAQIYDLETGRQLDRDFGPSSLMGATWSPDGQRIATASQVEAASLWNGNTRELLHRLPHPGAVFSARFSPDGRKVVTACSDGLARIWEAGEGRLVACLEGHAADVVGATFSPDGLLVATASRDNSARLWDARTFQPVGQVMEHPSWVYCVAFSPDARWVVTGCADHKARVWETGTKNRRLPDLVHHDVVQSAEFSPDGRLILTASYDGTARLWDAATLQAYDLLPVVRQGDRATHACFDATGRRLLTTGVDGSILVWDLTGIVRTPTPAGVSLSQDGRRAVAFTHAQFQVSDPLTGTNLGPARQVGFELARVEPTSDGRFVLAVSTPRARSGQTNCQAQLWAADTGTAVGPVLTIPRGGGGLLPSPDGQRFVAWTKTNLAIWDARLGRAVDLQLTHRGEILSVGLSPDGTRLATASQRAVCLWHLEDGSLELGPLEQLQPIVHVAFSPDGRRFVTCCSDNQMNRGAAQVWDAQTGRPAGGRLLHRDGVLFAAFSPDGRRLATVSEDFTAMIWDVATSRPLTPPLPHGHQVHWAAFSPDGLWVVTASSDFIARVWSATTGDPLTPPLRHKKLTRRVQFFPGGDRILAADFYGDAWTWHLPAVSMPDDEFVRLAALLSGDRSAAVPGNQDPPPTIRQVWEELRRRNPACFTSTQPQIEAWEAFQADQAEGARQWAALVFHLKQLAGFHPEDQALQERLAFAQARLADEN